MTESLYPTRTRCKKCRKLLAGTPIVDGIYCSYRCANVPAPSRNVDEAPRGCKRQIDGKWDFKKRYHSELEVPQRLRDDPATNIYRCEYCRSLHVGHNAPIAISDTALHRGVTSFEQMGSVIQRRREEMGLTRKQVANKINVPIVRITEVEEGNKNAKAEVLFAVLRELRLSVEIKSR